MKATAVVTIFLLALAGATLAGDSEEQWVSLFNGKDLTGWQPKLTGHELHDNYGDTFRVVDGKLLVSYDQYEKFGGKFGHIFHEKKLSHYRLRFEYRFVGEQAPEGPDWAFRNSGVMVHSQSGPSMGKDQDFPISIEVQMLGGERDRTTANLCTPGTNVVMDGKLVTDHCVNSSSEILTGDQWVKLEVEVRGSDKILHRVNGQVVMSYEKPQLGGGNVSGHDPAIEEDGKLLSEGYICLQAESHPVEFRNIEVLELQP